TGPLGICEPEAYFRFPVRLSRDMQNYKGLILAIFATSCLGLVLAVSQYWNSRPILVHLSVVLARVEHLDIEGGAFLVAARDSPLVATASCDVITVCDCDTKERTLLPGQLGRGAFGPNGLFARSDGDSIAVWRASDWKQLYTRRMSNGILALTFIDAGDRLAFGTN